MQSSKNHNPPHKHSQLTKKKKILLWTLIPTTLLGICGAGVGVGCAIWHNKTPEKPQPTPFPSSFIKINSNIATKYLITSGIDIYYDKDATLKCGHQLLDLKALSDANNGVCNFIIEGTITFGFLVDPNMNCFLFGDTNSLVSISAASDNACGVVVGLQKNPPGNIVYKGTMYIDNSANFVITSASDSGYGVYFYSAASGSTQTINGTFNISGGNSSYGVDIINTTNGYLTINGTFMIIGDGSAYGVRFQSTASGSVQTINGTFAISSITWDAYGVMFASTAAGSIQTINGTFTVSSAHDTRGVIFNGDASGSTTINGTFTITTGGTAGACGVYFYSTASGSTQTINGTFTITAGVMGSAFGVYFNGAAAGSLIMGETIFFSNKGDMSNVKDKYPSPAAWSYQWNGSTINVSTSLGTWDSDLTLTPIYDTATETSSNFSIKVISTCGSSNPFNLSKTTFNTAYKTALQTYVDSSDCPTTAKGWLESIIKKITT